ncbi:MAG TPA: NUDIX domain-containing protein [Anaerolineales bacterium]|nr:NUDIX domain-containing protein [Anaerolineales bacterium]
MSIGQFYAGIAAVIWSPTTEQYLLLHRSESKDYGPGVWECVTGRVDQGEGFEDALLREVREELGVQIQVEHILGTTHFYRGAPIPENELVGVVYLCTLPDPASIYISAEHSEFRWCSATQAMQLLSADDPSTQWARRVIERAEIIRLMLPQDLLDFQHQAGFEFG